MKTVLYDEGTIRIIASDLTTNYVGNLPLRLVYDPGPIACHAPFVDNAAGYPIDVDEIRDAVLG